MPNVNNKRDIAVEHVDQKQFGSERENVEKRDNQLEGEISLK